MYLRPGFFSFVASILPPPRFLLSTENACPNVDKRIYNLAQTAATWVFVSATSLLSCLSWEGTHTL